MKNCVSQPQQNQDFQKLIQSNFSGCPEIGLIGENCDQCATGWTGENCDQCAPGYSGENCEGILNNVFAF